MNNNNANNKPNFTFLYDYTGFYSSSLWRDIITNEGLDFHTHYDFKNENKILNDYETLTLNNYSNQDFFTLQSFNSLRARVGKNQDVTTYVPSILWWRFACAVCRMCNLMLNTTKTQEDLIANKLPNSFTNALLAIKEVLLINVLGLKLEEVEKLKIEIEDVPSLFLETLNVFTSTKQFYNEAEVLLNTIIEGMRKDVLEIISKLQTQTNPTNNTSFVAINKDNDDLYAKLLNINDILQKWTNSVISSFASSSKKEVNVRNVPNLSLLNNSNEQAEFIAKNYFKPTWYAINNNQLKIINESLKSLMQDKEHEDGTNEPNYCKDCLNGYCWSHGFNFFFRNNPLSQVLIKTKKAFNKEFIDPSYANYFNPVFFKNYYNSNNVYNKQDIPFIKFQTYINTQPGFSWFDALYLMQKVQGSNNFGTNGVSYLGISNLDGILVHNIRDYEGLELLKTYFGQMFNLAIYNFINEKNKNKELLENNELLLQEGKKVKSR